MKKAVVSSIEILESRIAPATLASPTTLTYTDVDGDHVTVKLSLPLLNAGNENTVFTFDTGSVNDDNTAHQQLESIDLAALATSGVGLAVSVVKVASSDGLANIGYVNSTGFDLGAVTIAGDLGRVNAGSDSATTPAVRSLSINSLGALGLESQGGSGDRTSDIVGKLGALTVKHDVDSALVEATGANGSIGTVSIGGSLIGGDASHSGEIVSTGSMGAVKIGGSIIGDTAISSSYAGDIACSGTLASVTIGGSIIGGDGNFNGTILCEGNIGAVKIGQDIQGGSGATCGYIECTGTLASVTIGGSLIGGSKVKAGEIISTGNMGAVKIGGSLKGGAGDESGKIDSGGALASVSIGGSIVGGGGDENTYTDDNNIVHVGQIFSIGPMGVVTVGHDVQGGSGLHAGSIDSFGTLASVTIGGSLIGGTMSGAGEILSDGAMGAVKIKHDVQGGSGDFSALIDSPSTLTSVTIGGSLIGGTADNTGTIFSNGNIGPVKIGHDVQGGSGAGEFTGLIDSQSALASVTIGGSLIGGSGLNAGEVFSGGTIGAVTVGHDVQGGSGDLAGLIQSTGTLASVTLGGSLIGGSGNRTGAIQSTSDLGPVSIGHDLIGGSVTGSASLFRSGIIASIGGRIASVTIGGSIFAGLDNSSGTLDNSAAIEAHDDLGSLKVKGGIVGSPDTGNGAALVIISARGQAVQGPTTDLAIGKISISGSVDYVQILAGYANATDATEPAASNADAQIGPVSVGGNWSASDLVAGAMNSNYPNFGGSGDAKISGTGTTDTAGILSKIASITIGGQVFGTPGILSTTDHFGFVAQQIGAVKIGGNAIVMPSDNIPEAIGETGTDMTIHILASP